MSAQYLLIDGALYEKALVRLYGRDEDLDIEPLYSGTPWQDVADIGPILVKPGFNSNLLEEVQTNPDWQRSYALLSSAAPFGDIASHLRQLNVLTDPVGVQCLLRYADPSVAYFWLSSHGASDLRQVLGPINKWFMSEPLPMWAQPEEPRLRSFESIEAGGDKPIHILTQTNIASLEAAYHFQLKNRLYAWLADNQPTDLERIPAASIAEWLEDQLISATNFGVTTERSLAIWCALSLREGAEFTETIGISIQKWLAGQTNNQLHTADQKLQHYYQDIV